MVYGITHYDGSVTFEIQSGKFMNADVSGDHVDPKETVPTV